MWWKHRCLGNNNSEKYWNKEEQLRNEIEKLKSTENNENSKENRRKNKTSEKKQHRKMVYQGITTQKFNENAKKNGKIELWGVARPFVQISESGPRSKKFGLPCSTSIIWAPEKPWFNRGLIKKQMTTTHEIRTLALWFSLPLFSERKWKDLVAPTSRRNPPLQTWKGCCSVQRGGST